MSRRLTYQRPDRWELFEVTARAMHGRYLLHPGEECGRRLLGVLGKALQHYGEAIHLHLLAGTSNHIHLLVSSKDSQTRADFKAFFMSNTSKELGLLHDWSQHLWGRRSMEIPVLDQRAARARAIYLLSHGRKEGLLPDGEPWPGLHWVRAVTEGYRLVGTWYNRTKLYRERQKWERRKPENKGKEPKAKDFAERIHVPLHPLPYMDEAGMDTGAQQHEWRRLLSIGKILYPTPERVLGLERLLGQHPHTRPGRSKRSFAPRAHFRDRGAYLQWKNDYKEFARAYRATSERLSEQLQGDSADIAYPPGGVIPVQLPRRRCPDWLEADHGRDQEDGQGHSVGEDPPDARAPAHAT